MTTIMKSMTKRSVNNRFDSDLDETKILGFSNITPFDEEDDEFDLPLDDLDTLDTFDSDEDDDY